MSVFGFPKDEELKQKWMHAIKRADFKPSATSKVSSFELFVLFADMLEALIPLPSIISTAIR